MALLQNIVTLDELDSREQEIMDSVWRLAGTEAERAEQIRVLGLCDEYRQIHRDYIALAQQDTPESLEALKRAMFLQWYAFSEPTCFTGLDELDHSLQKQVLSRIECYIERKSLDREFKRMLYWYYRLSDGYFEGFSGIEKLLVFIVTLKDELKTGNPPSLREPNGRGQMGRYFNEFIGEEDLT